MLFPYKAATLAASTNKAELIVALSPERKAKIKWQCRRGMLELDLMLTSFIDAHLDTLTAESLDDFEKLLACTDPFLYAVFIENVSPGADLDAIVSLIKMQPNLR